ncbi:MAG: hypothetical protein IJZ79_01370 [Bacilli bacterium]|nr:hypothetical protein [Bacilli bacterium]
MLDEKKLKEYDDYLVDRENRKMKGTLTNEEIAEDNAIKAEKAFVANFFKNLTEDNVPCIT